MPIYVSAEGPKGLRLGGRCADGVILGTGFDLRVLDWARQRILRGTREAVARTVKLLSSPPACSASATTAMKRAASSAIGLPTGRTNFRFTLETVPRNNWKESKFMAGFDVMKPMEDRVDPDLVNDYLVHRFSIAGTPKECIERIEELRDAGVEHLMLTSAQSLSRKRRGVCREGDTALQS